MGGDAHGRAAAGHDTARFRGKDRCRSVPRECNYEQDQLEINAEYTLKRLYDRSRWNLVRDQFRETFLTLYALPSQPLLCLSTHAGLSALRLPCCSTTLLAEEIPNEQTRRQSLNDLLNHDHDQSTEDLGKYLLPSSPTSPSTKRKEPEPKERPAGHVDCPTCGKHLSKLAAQVPMSHHVNSTIVCRISGEVMDSQNEPLAFHNGQVYSSNVSTHILCVSYGVVTDPSRLCAKWQRAISTSSLVLDRERLARSQGSAKCTFHDQTPAVRTLQKVVPHIIHCISHP